MNWAWVYLFIAAMTLAVGISHLVDWYHQGGHYHLLMGSSLVLLSPIWLMHWSEARKGKGL